MSRFLTSSVVIEIVFVKNDPKVKYVVDAKYNGEPIPGGEGKGVFVESEEQIADYLKSLRKVIFQDPEDPE